MGEVLKEHKKFFSLGIVLIVLGIGAIIVPFVSGLAVVIMIGIIFLANGFSHLIHAFHVREWKGVSFQMLSAALYLLVGAMFVIYPGAGLTAFTLMLAILLFMEGFMLIAMSFHLPAETNRGIVVFSGILNVLIGSLIWAEWPLSSVWFIGTLIGISLLFKGMALITLSSK
jgi:uncharacterized membrane protein HdeD (DUF308 family)